jgi:glutathione S-transferase
MILYGRDLSPFVRRIAIWCALQERAVERRQITVAGEDFARVKALNPVGRVPILELDDGTRLIDSHAIGDWLDETTPNGLRLLPPSGTARRDALQRLAVASGAADKAVALVYERNRRPAELHWQEWQQRLVGQIQGGLAALDAAAPEQGWTGEGAKPDAGDVAAVIALQFVEVTNPEVLEPGYPRLAALAERGMQMPEIAASKPAPA